MLFTFNSIENFNRSYGAFERDVFMKKPFVILVYATWCGHCKMMRDDWDDAASSAKGNHNIVEIESNIYDHLVNNHASEPFAELLSKNVSGFPTILKVDKKNTTNVSDQRSKQQLDALLSPSKTKTADLLKKYSSLKNQQ